MKRRVIAIDMDEVFFPFAAHFAEHHNRHHGTKLKRSDITTYRFEDIIGEDLEETVRRVHNATAEEHSHVRPIKGSPEAVRELEKKYDLILVTARNPEHEHRTLEWLNTHYADVFKHIIHVGHVGGGFKPVRKVDICIEYGAFCLIDDSPSHVNHCAENGLEGILFGEYPWNSEHELHDDVVRCKDWPAVLEHFDAKR